MTPKKLSFTGTPDDFVGMVRLFHQSLDMINKETGEPATTEEIAAQFMKHMNVDLGDYPDYKTLEQCCDGNEFREQILQIIERFRREN